MDFSSLKQLIDTMPERGIPFFDLVVTRDGEEVFRHSIDSSDKNNKKELARDELYWLYSTTKVITCTCAMQLIEQGKLKLDDPVSKYLPAYEHLRVRQKDGTVADAKNTMTIEHLFTMTSGIGPEHEMSKILYDAMGNSNYLTADIVNELPKIPLYFEPGTHYQYGFSHDVLAGVIEVITKMRYSDYAKKYIFDPLGMKDTGFRPTEEQLQRFAPSYTYDNSNGTSTQLPTKNIFNFPPNYDSGGAGLFSCASDYIKLVTTLACGGITKDGYRILKPETIELMEKNHLNPDALRDFVNGRLHGYGWGLCGRVHMNPVFSLSKSSVGEFGWDGAAGCFTAVDRKNKIAIFFGMQVFNCSYSYIILQPLIRTLVYKALDM